MSAQIFEDLNPNNPRTEGEQYLLDVFNKSERFSGWTVFEQPHINSMKPDFVLLHPNKGIIIIEVKDWNLSSSVYRKDGYIKGTNGRLYNKNPIDQVEKYKNGILKSDLENSEALVDTYSNYYGCIETVVYFHGATRENVLKFCGKNNNGYTKIWIDKDIEYISNTSNQLNAYKHTYALTPPDSTFNTAGMLERLVKELISYLSYSDYHEERRQPISLTTDQKKLAELKVNMIRRYSGVAGAGKSLVLVEKAVRALKQDKRVLLLTFNITLRHYLRDLCSQQFGTEEGTGERKKLRTNLTIVHFHQLLQIIMAEHEIPTGSNEEEMKEDFTSIWIDRINSYLLNNPKKDHFNYDYILIDEGQDFKGEWIRFLKQFFTGQGELFIVYDKAQDLYNHGIWIEDSKEIQHIGFRGKPGHLKFSHRLPIEMIEKIQQIRMELGIQEEKIYSLEGSQISLLAKIQWMNYSPITLQEKLRQIQNMISMLRRSKTLEDITILTTNENTGIEIVKYLKSMRIMVSHVYDLSGKKDIKKRRQEKWKFYAGTGTLKVCSYHSYKGWQTSNIILVLDAPSTNYSNNQIVSINYNEQSIKDALFISMSRIKAKATTGEFSFICLNYMPQYNHLINIFI